MSQYLKAFNAAWEAGDYQSVKRLLREMLREKGISIADIAKRHGVAYSGLYKALGEQGNPTLKRF